MGWKRKKIAQTPQGEDLLRALQDSLDAAYARQATANAKTFATTNRPMLQGQTGPLGSYLSNGTSFTSASSMPVSTNHFYPPNHFRSLAQQRIAELPEDATLYDYLALWAKTTREQLEKHSDLDGMSVQLQITDTNGVRQDLQVPARLFMQDMERPDYSLLRIRYDDDPVILALIDRMEMLL